MSNLKTRIQIGDKGYLDVTEDVVIPINYSIADIRDISKKTSTYTKTIELPGTANNNNLLGHLFDVNIADASFDINKKQECIILQNEVPVLEGILQLINVIKIAPSLGNGDEQIIYEVSVKEEIGDVFTSIGEKELRDLSGNINSPTWDIFDTKITLDKNSIIRTRQAGYTGSFLDGYANGFSLQSGATTGVDWSNIYTYFSPYTPNTEYLFEEFKPAIFAKIYWDNIFADAGYETRWLTRDAKDIFEKLIIPFKYEDDLKDVEEYKVDATISTYTYELNYNDYVTNAFIDYWGETDTPISTTYPVNIRVPFNYEIKDPSDLFNTTDFSYTSTIFNRYNIRTAFEYDIYLYVPYDMRLVGQYVATKQPPFDAIGPATIFLNDPSELPAGYEIVATDSSLNEIRIKIDQIFLAKTCSEFSSPNYYVRHLAPNDASNLIDFSLNGAIFNLSSGYNKINSNGLTNFPNRTKSPELTWSIPLDAGDKVTQGFRNFTSIRGRWVKTSDLSPVPDADLPKLVIKFGPDNSTVSTESRAHNYFKVEPSTAFQFGDTAKIRDFIPRGVKQKDFVASIAKMFNLYFEKDKDDESLIYVYTRDDYYASTRGEVLDWTDKISLDNEIKLEFLPDVTSKSKLFTYTPDNENDPYGKEYTYETGEIFGQYEYIFDNDFVLDENKIQPMFGPTLLDENGMGNVVAAIENNKKTNLRILYYGGWLEGRNWSISFRNFYPGCDFVGTPPSTRELLTYNGEYWGYPYAGHLDNPYNPTIDINFGSALFEFYEGWENYTNNNLYNLFYKNQIRQIENGRMMTAKFNLNEYDIHNFSFNDKIFIHDQYWVVNRIIDYNANANELTTVELISLEDTYTFQPNQIQIQRIGERKTNKRDINNPRTDELNFFGDKIVNSEVYGVNNVINSYTRETVVVGDNNNISSNQSFIIGNNNTVIGDNVIAIGVNDSYIDQDNTIVIGKPIVQYVNYINAGRNEVLNPYNTVKTIDLISGSRDQVRELGSRSLEMIVKAGKDRVL